ncbi:MAG: hypothetical protein QW780_05085 [Sulfolobales archaeon]
MTAIPEVLEARVLGVALKPDEVPSGIGDEDEAMKSTNTAEPLDGELRSLVTNAVSLAICGFARSLKFIEYSKLLSHK